MKQSPNNPEPAAAGLEGTARAAAGELPAGGLSFKAARVRQKEGSSENDMGLMIQIVNVLVVLGVAFVTHSSLWHIALRRPDAV